MAPIKKSKAMNKSLFGNIFDATSNKLYHTYESYLSLKFEVVKYEVSCTRGILDQRS